MSTRKILYLLARQRFTDAHRARVAELSGRAAQRWDVIAAQAAMEGVAPIVGANLALCGASTNAPSAIGARLERALYENVAVKFQRREQLRAGLVHFNASGYDVLLVKSAALEASGVYLNPWVTCARDIDLVLRRRDTAWIAPEEWAVRAVSRDRGIECEVHGHHDVSMYGLVPLSFADIWRDAHAVVVDQGAPAFVMCPEDLLFTLCVNACRQNYFRLKVLFDIAETVAHHPGLDWDGVRARAESSSSCGILFTALCAADETLGLPALDRRYDQFIPARHARVLRTMVRGIGDSSGRCRWRRLALRYASLNGGQRRQSVARTAMQWPSRQLTARDAADGTLPGE